jgi:hypothetical protein
MLVAAGTRNPKEGTMIERWMSSGDRAVCLQSVAPIRGVKRYVLDNRPN